MYENSSMFLSFSNKSILTVAQPHTIGLALHDNPLAILMWVGEKFIEASNPENQSDPSWTHAILTTASLYYFSNCIMSSMLPYYENIEHDKFAEFVVQPENRIKVPFGYTSFFWDTEPSSRRAVGRTGELVFYKGMYCFMRIPFNVALMNYRA